MMATPDSAGEDMAALNLGTVVFFLSLVAPTCM
jgi:hypothetical protein